MTGPAEDRVFLFNEIGEAGSELWGAARRVSGPSNDPKIVGVLLYRRLWSNFRGFRLLWAENLSTEAEMVLRSAVETVICLAALRVQGRLFVDLLRSDAAVTMQTQVQLVREAGEAELADKDEAQLRAMFGTARPDGTRHRTLVWKDLANVTDDPWLYGEYRNLSGVAAHVSGVSLIHDTEDVEAPGDAVQQQKQRAILRYIRLDKMSRVMTLGCRDYAIIAEDDAAVERMEELMKRLDRLGSPAP